MAKHPPTDGQSETHPLPQPRLRPEGHAPGAGRDEPTVDLAPAAQAPRPSTGPSGSAPPSGPGDAGAHELAQGTRVERYILLKSVGRGGMGVVYAAYDPDLDRKVALKLLRTDRKTPRGMTGREWMLREAQAMARISHPNVIPVFDVGTFGSQVFVAMEFVQGQTLHDWICAEQRTWRQTLRLFLEAGQGLAAAHRAGLVHQDFKPANVLVSTAERVYVMDFGLALLADVAEQQEASRAGEAWAPPEREVALALSLDSGIAMGTPQYMPPEQYLGRGVDARADQFSFCAALYWALYRQRPFEPKQMARAASSATGDSPVTEETWRKLPHASAVQQAPAQPQVPAWVRKVMMRGLSLHPEDRFASMEELLRVLSQEQRRVRRQGSLVAVGLAGLAAVGVGLYAHRQSQLCEGSEPLVAQVWGSTARQKLLAAFAATGKPFSDQSAQSVMRAMDEYASRWARMHTQACEATRVSGVQTEELLSVRMVCLERRRQNLGALASLLSEADAAMVERAVDAAAALPALEACQDIASLAEQPPLPADPALRSTIQRLSEQLAQVQALHDAGRYKAGLEQAARLEAEVAATAWGPLRAELNFLLGALLQQQGETEASLRRLEQAFGEAQASRSDRTGLEVLIRFTFTLANNGHPEEARRWGQVAQSLLQRLGGDGLLELELRRMLGNVALAQGRYREAWDSFDKARALAEQLLAPEHPQRSRVSYGLGLAALSLGEHARAIELLSQALEQTEAAKGRVHPHTGNRHTMLATAYRESGDLVQALVHVHEALEIYKAALGPEHPLVADALDELGMSLIGVKRYDEAIARFQEALALKRKSQGEDHPDLSHSLDGIGQALLAQGKAAEAIAPLEQALSHEDTHPEQLAQSGFALARALWQVGKEPERARAEARRARERYVKLEKPAQVAEIDAWLASR